MKRRGAAVVAALLLLAPGAVPTVSTPAQAAPVTVETTLRAAVKALPVKAERNSGYDRDAQFGRWIDANKDCQDTRHEVLIQESKVKVRFSSSSGGCRVYSGEWKSLLDGKVYKLASSVHIDHHVPVHEAWGSGARDWTKARRVAFYNDLTDNRALNAVTPGVNSSKGASDPAQWMPPAGRCGYIKSWVAVKSRWRLSVDSTEKAVLTNYANKCAHTRLTYTRP